MTRVVILQTGHGDRFWLRRRKKGPTRLLVKNGMRFEFRAIGKLRRESGRWHFKPQHWKCNPLEARTSIAVAMLAVEEFLKEPHHLEFRERKDQWTILQLRHEKQP